MRRVSVAQSKIQPDGSVMMRVNALDRQEGDEEEYNRTVATCSLRDEAPGRIRIAMTIEDEGKIYRRVEFRNLELEGNALHFRLGVGLAEMAMEPALALEAEHWDLLGNKEALGAVSSMAALGS